MLITLNHLKSSLQAVKNYINNVLPKKVSDLVDDSGHYTKPSGGIPASDLADGVVPVEDVQVNGTSILSNGVANVPPMAYENYGVARVNADYGIYNIASTSAQHGVLYIQKASDLQIKEGTGIYRPIVPSVQNASTFYGLAKAAGDSTQSASSNAVGAYTDDAKSAIKTMLGVPTDSYDLNLGAAIPTNADLDTYTAPGTYNADDTVVASILHAPTTTEAYKLIIESIGVATIKQTVTIAGGSKFSRIGNSDSTNWVFGDWVNEVASDIPVAKGTGVGSLIIGDTANNIASKAYSYAEGNRTTASGSNAHSEGYSTQALGDQSHTEGATTTASGTNSHAEGGGTTSSGSQSHAEGAGTTASGTNAHAEGGNTIASQANAHAEGANTTASGGQSHSEGLQTTAQGFQSHAEGWGTIAGSANQHVQGKFNVADYNDVYAHIVGGGSSTSSRNNIQTLDWNGNESIAGSLTIGKGTVSEVEITPNIIKPLIITAIPASADLNSYTTPGNYTADSTVIASITHAPTTTVEYKLTVEQISDNVIKQTVTTTETPANVYQRTGDSSSTDWVFGDWVKQIKSTDYATSSASGVVKINSDYGIYMRNDNTLGINAASDSQIKAGTNGSRPIVSVNEHSATFYGLAKAAGDVTQSTSNNEVGTYTDEAKTAINKMIGSYGLNPGEAIPTNADLNTYTTPGTYNADSTVITSITNAPTTTETYKLIVESIDDDLIRQTAISKSHVYQRTGDVSTSSWVFTDWVQNITSTDYASTTTGGVVKITAGAGGGINLNASNQLVTLKATSAQAKAGTDNYHPIVPYNEHEATFYGLAKAAGDTTQSSSSNAVGTYTTEAKSAIQTMLGVTVPEAVGSCVEYISDSSVTIVGEPNTRYVCGEVTSISITPPAVGTIDVTFTSGSTIAILTLPSTVKMPEWWGGVETGYTYELVITDGVYAGVMAWPQ